MSITNNPIIGKGTTVTISNPNVNSGTAVTIAKVNNIKLPTIVYKDVEVTGMDSTIEDFIPGFANAGEAELDLTYLGTQSNTLKSFCGIAGTTIVVTRSNTGVATIVGYMNTYTDEIPLKEKARNTFKVKATALYTDA